MEHNNDIPQMFGGVNDMRIAKSRVASEKCGEWIYSIMRIIIIGKTSLANHGLSPLPNIPTTRYAKHWPNLYMNSINQSPHKAYHIYYLISSILLAAAPDLQQKK